MIRSSQNLFETGSVGISISLDQSGSGDLEGNQTQVSSEEVAVTFLGQNIFQVMASPYLYSAQLNR